MPRVLKTAKKRMSFAKGQQHGAPLVECSTRPPNSSKTEGKLSQGAISNCIRLRFGVYPVWAAQLGTTPKSCELQLFFARIAQVVRRWKALDLGRLNVQFQYDWPKGKKNYSFFNFLPENRKILLN